MNASNEDVFCKSCKTYRATSFFASATRRVPFRTCSVCRHRQTPVMIDENRMIDRDQFLQSYPNVKTVEIDGVESRLTTFKFKGYVRCEELASLMGNDAVDNAEAFRRIAKQYVALVESADGYAYHVRNVGQPKRQSRIRFSAYCIQDERTQRQEKDDSARERRRMQTYNCNGVIHGVVDIPNKCIHLDVNHDSVDQHPPPPPAAEN